MRLQLKLDSAEALAAILKHEKVAFTTGVGPGGPVIDVDTTTEKLMEVVMQWATALQGIVFAAAAAT